MKKNKEVNKGDLLTFKAADGKYKALLCTSVYKDKSPHNFSFAVLTYDSIEKPTFEKILEGEFFGIGNRYSCFAYSDNEVERMWTLHPEINPYHLGSYGLIIWRKEFVKFRDNIEIIGNIEIIDHLDKNGNGGMNGSDWNFLQDFFNEKFKTILPDRGQKVFKIKAILRD